jgi:hypothetical protein
MKHRTPSRLLAILLAGLLAACAPTQQDGTAAKSQPRSDQSALGRVAESETRPTAQASRQAPCSEQPRTPTDSLLSHPRRPSHAATRRDDGGQRPARQSDRKKGGESMKWMPGWPPTGCPSPCSRSRAPMRLPPCRPRRASATASSRTTRSSRSPKRRCPPSASMSIPAATAMCDACSMPANCRPPTRCASRN